MAALSAAARHKIARGLRRWWSKRFVQTSGLTKDDLYDPDTNTGAVAECDDWIDGHRGNTGNTAGYNRALSQLFRGEAAAQMKSELFLVVAAGRTDDADDITRRIASVGVD